MTTRILPFLALLAACSPSAEGLRATPQGDGPEVVIDWDAEPLPEIPLPNDMATTPDATSPTGLRVNIPTEATTLYETESRLKIDELFGWGIYAPITVSFSESLDVGNIVARHPNDFEKEDAFADDAFYVIDVDPDSPDYGKPVSLDVGHGRFPVDAFRTDRYFPNDTRSASPSILFDTVDEDLNHNGVLDPGEDTDNDGILDVPNVWPPGGDPFEDLLTFYDLETNMLLFRPVVPMREETTYAVVLTNRLVGESGQPVRSPWPYVNHTRQTSALEPLVDLLPDFGLTVDDVAFAWTFTTGRVTGDLKDIREGMFDGTGPFRRLAKDFPPGFVEADQVSGRSIDDKYNFPTEVLSSLLGPLGLLGDSAGEDVLLDGMRSFSSRLVGGAFVTPNFMVDTDDGGTWDADEWFKVDPYTGSMAVEGERVTFNCVLPDPADGIEPPYDVMLYGHGYGSTRLEFLLFAPVMNRFGLAVCSFDFPGHGPGVDPDQLAEISGLLGPLGLAPLGFNLLDARYRDLNNDGVPDSGGDQWSADPFHTRDMVRQAVVDWMQVVRTLRGCGTGTMPLYDYDAEGNAYPAGGDRMQCDWDDDGVPDIGGPDANLYIVGGSLGGINSGVAAGVVPGITAWSPVVPGCGIVDVGVRTQIGGAVEAFIGRFVSPLILGLPQEDGSLRISELVNSVTDMVELPIDSIGTIPAGGTVVVTNLETGEESRGMIPADGRFRVAIAADALDAGEKRLAVDMPMSGPEDGVVYSVPDNAGLGDHLVVELFDADGTSVAVFDTWGADVVHEGVTYPAGSPLVAGSEGNGKIRGSKDARRLAQVAAMVMEPGDPVAYASHWFTDPDPYIGPQNVLLMPTPGDDQVPINGGMACARIAGFTDWHHVDERYGMTVDQWLIDRQVVRGAEERGPWRNAEGDPVLFDADDLDDGINVYGEPSDTPLRSTLDTPAGQSGLRLPYVSPKGTHGFRTPDPSLAFDINSFAIYQIAQYLDTQGKQLQDRPCYGTGDCPDFQAFDGDGGAQ
ncbi:MAG: hypothetical protein H6733_01855 [Alphaproteobacteria bacterium]|nr:hypothetical protein [Alphaproteobacteria bacterium]